MGTALVQVDCGAIIHSDVDNPDLQVIEMWLHGRGHNTQRSYRGAIKRFLAFTEKPLQTVTLVDCQGFVDSLQHLAPATQHVTIAALKSLFRFGKDIGYLQVDPVRVLRLPKYESRLAERILSEDEVFRMIELEENHRDRVILELLYFGALRISELSGLKWRNLQQTSDGGQVTVFGKGGKTRSIGIPGDVFDDIMALKPAHARYDDPVFAAGHMCGGTKTLNIKPRRVEYMVRDAAERAGIDKPVSPHWLRHSHATHAIENGAPIHLVQKTLGHSSLATTEKYLHARPGKSSATYLKPRK
jgi:integrase/recombinase XerD